MQLGFLPCYKTSFWSAFLVPSRIGAALISSAPVLTAQPPWSSSDIVKPEPDSLTNLPSLVTSSGASLRFGPGGSFAAYLSLQSSESRATIATC